MPNFGRSVYSDDGRKQLVAEADMNNLATTVPGYTQEEGIDYDEVFAPVARIEAIRLFLAYASFMNFIVYHMDVKSAWCMHQLKKRFFLPTSRGTGSDSGPKCQDTILGGAEAQIRFEATAKAKTVNGERQIQALIDKKKVIIIEKSVRSDLMLEDAEGTEGCIQTGEENSYLDDEAVGDSIVKSPIVNVAKTTSSSPVSAVDLVTTVGELVTTASATTIVDELTLAQTLIEIKAAKPMAVTTAAIT
ncbi:retrovirus-related pol polyprotein from transposon TNT 1-94 [Tanacetum coccineum]|uniref:Retrovirus-related pol polyprotein from transposon TNT 1-94 n=1 Tax=Tanacetum coccineum TaxID=301880 RepID=A0ABQ5JG44_9ASTR